MKILTLKTTTFYAFFFLFFFSCTDDENFNTKGKNVHQINTELRSGFSLQWLEQMRLHLLDTNAVYKYSVEEAAYGVSTLYNILAAYGVAEIENPLIIVDTISFTIANDSMNETQMVALSDFVVSHISDNVFKLDTGLLMLDIVSSISGNTALFKVESIIGDLSYVDLQNGNDMTCNNNSFSSSDCYLSASGDLDGGSSLLYPAGPCDSPNTLTSAQEEVQKVLVNSIPKYVYNNKGVITGAIKYYNNNDVPIELWQGVLTEFLENYSNCEPFGLNYNDEIEFSELRYSGDELNCTVCALKDYLNSICPSGKVICYVNLWGDQLGGGYWKWRAEVRFCNATTVSWEAEPNPEIVIDGPGILGSNSILEI